MEATMKKLITIMIAAACTFAYSATYYISQGATGTYDGSTLLTGFTNIYNADQTINYADGDVIRIDAGTNGDNLGYVYDWDTAPDSWAQCRFMKLRAATNANNVTLEGINGIPVIDAPYTPIELYGVRYGCTIKRLFLNSRGNECIKIINSHNYDGVDVAAPASLYPSGRADNTIESCIVSNSTGVCGIVIGNDEWGAENDITNTIARGTVIVSNKVINTNVGDSFSGAIHLNVHEVGDDVSIIYNDVAGPGGTVETWRVGIRVQHNGGKDTNYFIAWNTVHGWRDRGMMLDLGSSEIRENTIWDIGYDAVEVAGGVPGGPPNKFVNNTIFDVGKLGGGNCVWAPYDVGATNWWINNLFVSNNNAGGYVIWSTDSVDMFDPNMSYNVANILGGDSAFESGTNYWNEDPAFVSMDPNHPDFLVLWYGFSSSNALYRGTNLFGGRSYLGAREPLPIPEPAFLLGIVLLSACLWRR